MVLSHATEAVPIEASAIAIAIDDLRITQPPP